jgi:hypothetical protein
MWNLHRAVFSPSKIDLRSGLPIRWSSNMRLLLGAAIGLLLGCSAENAPPQLQPTHREAIRQNLLKLGAQVTTDIPEGLYLSLRNTHVEVRDLGGVVEGSRRTQSDIRDFYRVNEAITKCFADAGQLEDFKRWYRESLLQSNSTVPRGEFGDVTLTISRSPLRTIFSRKVLLAEKQAQPSN